MLKVKTYIKESTIPNGGIGLFAGEDIEKGKIIWQFNPIIDKVISVHDLQYLDEIEKKFINIYTYRENDKLILCTDNNRFINHSETYNVDDTINKFFGSISTANRDIKKDEELLCDYSTFHDDYKTGVKFKNK